MAALRVIHTDDGDILCPFCEDETESGEEGHYCYDCAKLYNMCERCDGNPVLTFVSATMPLSDVGYFNGLMPATDPDTIERSTRMFARTGLYGDEESYGIFVNRNGEADYVNLGSPRCGLSDAAAYLWHCASCQKDYCTNAD
jgi:hypothetical protein